MTLTTTQPQYRLVRWRGGQHPTLDTITRLMRDEQLRPYVWVNAPNSRHPVRSHGYDKTIYCVQGSIEIILPDPRQRVLLGPLNEKWANLTDMDGREWVALTPLLILTILFGVWPGPILNGLAPFMEQLTTALRSVSSTVAGL